MRRNQNLTEIERQTENVHEFDFIFFGFGGRISANTTGNFDKIFTYTTTCFALILVIMKAIDGLSSETIVWLFYKHNTIDYRILWDNTQSDYKDHELNAVTWNNLYCKGISAIWERNKSKLYRHFLRFRPRIWFICERSAENKTMQFGCRYGFGSVSVRIRCVCETGLSVIIITTDIIDWSTVSRVIRTDIFRFMDSDIEDIQIFGMNMSIISSSEAKNAYFWFCWHFWVHLLDHF